MRCILIGNYGVGNLGDEALREYFLQAFAMVEWTILSACPQGSYDVPRLPVGIASLLQTPWWKTIKAMRRCDAVIFGGGSLFTDTESVYACFLWSFHALVAVLCGKPVLLAFQGMGPYRTWIGEVLARWTARHAVFVSVRDPTSMERVQQWDLRTKVVQTFDPVYALMEEKKLAANPQKVFTIIPRHNSKKELDQVAVDIATSTSDFDIVHILLMQPKSMRERGIAERIASALPLEARIIPISTLDELMNEVSGSLVVLSQRFHGALAALAAGIPTRILPQEEGDKLAELVAYAEGTKPTLQLHQLVRRGEEALTFAIFARNQTIVSL